MYVCFSLPIFKGNKFVCFLQVYGKLATYDNYERFEWSHSYSKVYYPKTRYEPRGVFLYFENYNVELRERVKCISAIEGKFCNNYRPT